MKKLIACLCCFLCLLTVYPALGEYTSTRDPDPIVPIEDDHITPTPQGMKHYMLICCDTWQTDPNDIQHTDGMILLSVDSIAKRVMLTSFIRDMLILRPDGKFGRLNNVCLYFGHNRDGIEALTHTLSTHFDVRIDKYLVVDFGQVEKIVDAIGGVDITISLREANYLKNYRISPSSTEPAIDGAGTYHFSGHAAVIYMRIRKVHTISGATQDVGRTERARTVLTTIADSLKDISYEDALKLLDVILSNTVMTNLTSAECLEAVDIAMGLRGVPVEGIRMPVDNTYELLPVAGMATQQVDFAANRDALSEFLYGGSFAVIDE